MNAGVRTGAVLRCLGLIAGTALFLPPPAQSQAGSPRTSLAAPTIQVGLSAYSAELEGGDATDLGVTLKAGVRLPFLEFTALYERWDQVRGFRYASALLETSFYFAGYRHLAPFLLVGAGHTWQRYVGDYPIDLAEDGPAAALGLGVRVAALGGTDARVEGLVRSDVGGYSGSARILVGWAPELRGSSPDALAAHGDAFLSWMIPLSGPWRFVEPGFGFRLERSAQRWGGTLGIAVFHWDIPGDVYPGVPGLSRSYIWDTRAFVATPGLVWHAQGTMPIDLRVGPAITVMGEGPGNGANFGGHAAGLVRPFQSMPLSLGLGWFWMRSHNRGDSRFTDDDQHGLTLSAALGF